MLKWTRMPDNCRPRLILLPLALAFGAAAAGTTITLYSAGSTFIYPILGKWSTEYRKLHPEVRISYEPVGSGRGIAQTLAGTVDFGASDGPISDAQLERSERKILHIPVVLGAVVPAYNLPGIAPEIRFTPTALAGIFLGTIKHWNDPELTRANPGIHLPGNEISLLFRSDSSGTSYVWTDYLSKISSEWSKRVGKGTSVNFPAGFGVQFNEGIQAEVKSHPYSIGYLEVTYAFQGQVQYGLVQNSSGAFVKATGASITAAAAALAKDMPDDFRASITNAPTSDAYPISSFTWLLVPERISDGVKSKAIVEFVRWVLTDGQKLAPALNYAPLPTVVASRALKAIDRVQ
jgi:phosphate transport system substrate-binding protein